MRLTLELDGKHFEVTVEEDGSIEVDGESFAPLRRAIGHGQLVRVGPESHIVEAIGDGQATIDGVQIEYQLVSLTGAAGLGSDEDAARSVHPPMTGTIERVAVSVGDEVEEGQILFVLEAMKMRNDVRAAATGRVEHIHVAVGDKVTPETLAVELGALE